MGTWTISTGFLSAAVLSQESCAPQVLDRVRLASLLQVQAVLALCITFMEVRMPSLVLRCGAWGERWCPDKWVCGYWVPFPELLVMTSLAESLERRSVGGRHAATRVLRSTPCQVTRALGRLCPPASRVCSVTHDCLCGQADLVIETKRTWPVVRDAAVCLVLAGVLPRTSHPWGCMMCQPACKQCFHAMPGCGGASCGEGEGAG